MEVKELTVKRGTYLGSAMPGHMSMIKTTVTTSQIIMFRLVIGPSHLSHLEGVAIMDIHT
jgi:hypothetical protein